MADNSVRVPERDGERGDGSVAFEVYVPVDVERLDDELAEAHRWDDFPGLVAEGDPAAASEDAPVTIWVLRDNVDAGVFDKVVTAHESESPAQGVEPGIDLGPLIDKAEEGEDLTPEETQQVLRVFLLQQRG